MTKLLLAITFLWFLVCLAGVLFPPAGAHAQGGVVIGWVLLAAMLGIDFLWLIARALFAIGKRR